MMINLTVPSVCAAAVWSVLAAAGSLAIYMKLPARWLCEYGELPTPAHEPAGRCGGTASGRLVRTAAAAAAALTCLVMPALALHIPVNPAACPASVDQSSVDQTSVIPAPVDQSQVDSASVNPISSVDPTQVDQSPVDQTSVIPAPVDQSQVDSASAGPISSVDSAPVYPFPPVDPFPSSDPALIILITATVICLILAALSDLDYLIIPDQITGALFLLALVRFAFLPAAASLISGFSQQASSDFTDGLLTALSGAALAGGLMLLAALPARLICGSGALGVGDIKLLSACGAVVGGSRALLLYVIAVFSSAIFMAAGLAAGKFALRSAHPMAPWIAAATVICMPGAL